MQELDKQTDIFEPVIFTNISTRRIFTNTYSEELFQIYGLIGKQWNLNVNDNGHLLIIEKILIKSIKFN